METCVAGLGKLVCLSELLKRVQEVPNVFLASFPTCPHPRYNLRSSPSSASWGAHPCRGQVLGLLDAPGVGLWGRWPEVGEQEKGEAGIFILHLLPVPLSPRLTPVGAPVQGPHCHWAQ